MSVGPTRGVKLRVQNLFLSEPGGSQNQMHLRNHSQASRHQEAGLSLDCERTQGLRIPMA